MSKSNKFTVQKLAVCAIMIALGTVLSNVKVFHFPTGGSITMFSMLIICLPAYWYGLGTGIFTAIAYGILQLIIDPYILYPTQLIVDYILAFGAMGLAGIFSGKKNGLIPGYLVGITGRFIFAVISGAIFFGEYAWEGWNAWTYSIVYNAIYIYAEGLITVAILLVKPVRVTLEDSIKKIIFKSE